jgi:hypothetical protein
MMVSKGAEKYAGITEREKYKYVWATILTRK